MLTREIAGCALQVLPNSSALVGGLVAARLAAEAGGIRELAMMPASSLQVLGSRKALFAHLATGSPPPKHGVVFQHGRVHGSRKERRGRGPGAGKLSSRRGLIITERTGSRLCRNATKQSGKQGRLNDMD
jgi:hypothetical protein